MKFVAKLRNVAAVAALVAIPAVAGATSQVAIESRTAVANQTAGDTVYTKSVNAKTDEVVKVQVWYHNKEEANSGKVAQNLNVKINIPSAPGKAQTITGTVRADNSNTVVDTANVNLALDQSQLEYIPGSAQWRHNTGTNDAPNWVTEKISDQVVGTGINLGNEQPCFNFEANVTVLARVKTPAVSITKKVRVVGQKDWVTSNTAKAGDTLEYLITFKNEGNTTLNNVVIGDNMPANLTYVKGSTKLINGANPNGLAIGNDNIVNGGINVGNYTPGAGGYVIIQSKVNPTLNPGEHTFTNVALVKADKTVIYNTAITKVTVGTTPTVPPTTPVTPTTPPTPALPQTGVEAGVAGLMGTGTLTYAGYFYRKSRKGLTEALKNVVK